MTEIIKAIILGIVEGVTEWLPISSTGHMILVDEFLHLDVTPEFKELFLVVIQLGAILAVIFLFWKKIWPLGWERGKPKVKPDILRMWLKIIVACVPAAVVGLLLDDILNRLFYNYWTVAVMLILFGVLFLVVENKNRSRIPTITAADQIDYKTALLIGVFQLIAAVFPGTSRSGATIVGALLLGVSRVAAAEFTFYLAIPVMLGASAWKLLKFGLAFSGTEITVLAVGMGVAFLVSVLVIRFLMGYIKKHDFKVFGWYRIVLGAVVLGYFLLIG